jgi:pimeloyl-ACP methyl ester carboxylesterase
LSDRTPFIRGAQVRSADGTEISFLVQGSGPVIIGIHGGLGTAVSLLPLAKHLSADFTIALVNLRGHGTSGRGLSEPQVDRYIEDVLAVIEWFGRVDALFGYSFGAVVALETAVAAADLVPCLVVYEPPLPITYPLPDVGWLESMLDEGRYEELIVQALAAGAGGLSPAELATAQENPLWHSNVAHAPTLLPTMRVLGQLRRTVGQYQSITARTTLGIGAESAEHLRRAGELLAEAIPHITVRHLLGQGHHFNPAALAMVVADAARAALPRM